MNEQITVTAAQMPITLSEYFLNINIEGEGTYYGIYDQWTKVDDKNNLKYVGETHTISKLNKICVEKYMTSCRSSHTQAIQARHAAKESK